MLYFIFGEDNFRSQKYLFEVRDFYKDKGASFFSCDFSDKLSASFDISALEDLFKSNTLFSGSKLVTIKNLFKNTNIEFRKELLAVLKSRKIDEAKDIMVIFYEDNTVRSSSLRKWLEEKAKGVKEFPLLKKKGLERWIIEEEQKIGLKLTLEGRQLILISFPSDTGSIYYSLEKLALIKKGLISKELIEENLFLPLNSNIFSFLDNLVEGNTKRTFWFLETLMNQGIHPLYILKMIIFQFRNLLIIKSLQAKPPSMHPYVFQKLHHLAKIISLEVLKSIFQRLLYYDRRIKRGNIDGQVALEMFLVDFSKQKC
ncbi:MAG: DNA polymerase III subunit delta [Candidatus Pacebacteria bacterium]|nr:DNA polymerase III subunit delta [Candidatus Paceibacterota bacterium]